MPQTLNQQIDQAVNIMQQGGVIAYPTEAVYGLGCDPFNQAAVEKLFHVKQRPIEKGIILIAASVEQVLPLVKLKDEAWEEKVIATWPGPVTWVLPVAGVLPAWITGGRDTVAIRVSAHPLVQQLCSTFGGPIVSTSANLTGQAPCKSALEIKQTFADKVFCLEGELGNLAQPTQIWDAEKNQRLR